VPGGHQSADRAGRGVLALDLIRDAVQLAAKCVNELGALVRNRRSITSKE
jgi:hypothetical protein